MSHRQTDIPCPLCGAALLQPVPEWGHHEWDCYVCGLEVPNTVHVEGENLIAFLRTCGPFAHLVIKNLFGDSVKFPSDEDLKNCT